MKSLLVAAAVAALTATLGTASVQAKTMSSKMMPSCSAGDKVVWVNTHSKVFYEPGGAYYGKTKHGKYVCESAATSMGMHMAKGGMMGDANGMSMHHSGMMKHRMMGTMGGSMHSDMKSGSMHSGSMHSGSMNSGSMKSGSAKSGSMNSGTTGTNTSGSTGIGSSGSGAAAGPGNLVTPAPVVSASPSN